VQVPAVVTLDAPALAEERARRRDLGLLRNLGVVKRAPIIAAVGPISANPAVVVLHLLLLLIEFV